MHRGGGHGHTDPPRLVVEFGRQPYGFALQANQHSGFAVARPFAILRQGVMRLEIVVQLLHAHVAQADAVADRVIVRLGEFRPGVRGQIAVAGGVDKRFGHECFAAGPALDNHTFETRAPPDGAGKQAVDADRYAGFVQHLEDHEFVDFGVDSRANGVVIVAQRHFGMAGTAAGLDQPIDYLLRNAAHDVPLLNPGKGLPEVVETVQRRAAFHYRAAGISLGFDESFACALARGGKRRHDTAGASAGDYHIESAHRQLSCGLFVGIVFCAGRERASCQQQLLGKTSAIHDKVFGQASAIGTVRLRLELED